MNDTAGWRSARACALRVLAEVEAGGWSDRLLQSHESRLDDPRERRLLHRLVLATLRWQGALDHQLTPAVRGSWAALEPRVRAALRLGLVQAGQLELPAPIAVDATLEALRATGGSSAIGLVNAVLRRVIARGEPLELERTVPAWLRQRWIDNYGSERAGALLAHINDPVPAHFVVVGDTPRDQVLAELVAAGLPARPSQRDPDGVFVARGSAIETEPFRRGALVAMDEAAALVAALARPADSRPAVDLAAAPGGKTVRLSHWARGPLVALEIHGGRCRRLAQALSDRHRPVAVLRADATAPPLSSGAFGTVLLDAPCSGSGTLRRRPERRQRITPEQISALAELQSRLLDAAVALLAPGGTLVYAVCSLEPEEGVAQLARALARHPQLEPLDPGARLGEGAAGLVMADPPRLETRPDREAHDGFVAAAMIRRR